MNDYEHSLDPVLRWARDEYLGRGFGETSRDMVIKELRKALFSIVDNLLEDTNQNEPPFKPELLAPKRRINAIVEIPLSRAKALLIPQIGGFVLKIRSDMHPFQRRFSCAHEIGHTFFFNTNIDPPRKEFQYHKSRYWVEEEFSSAIAREILLPTPSICDAVERDHLTPSISALRYLSSIDQISFEPLRLKLINDIPLWDCVVFKARLFDNKVVIEKRDISKGVSFRDVRIPHVILKDSVHSKLFTVVLSTIEKKRLREKVHIGKKEYAVETALLNYAKPIIMGVLTNI